MCGNCTAALQRGYGHGGGGSQPCQMFGAVLQALSACAVPSARAAPHRLSSALHPEGAHGPGVLLALLWSTDVLIACPALVQGAGEMELEGDMGVTAGVAPLHPAGAGEEQPPSTQVPPAASMQQDRGETDYCGLQHQFRRCWGSLGSTGSTQCLPLGPHCLGASCGMLGWAALGLAQKRFGVWRCRSPGPANAGSSKTHPSLGQL